MYSFSKKILILLSAYSLWIAPVGAISSGGSVASLEGSHASLVGSIMVSGGLAQASGEAAEASFKAIEASAEFGHEMVVTSVTFVGDMAQLTIRTSAAGVEASGKAIEFTLEVSKTAFEASVKGMEKVFNLMVKGSEVAVKSIALVAGASATVIGFSLVLVASPAIVVGVVLNELGEQLYADEL